MKKYICMIFMIGLAIGVSATPQKVRAAERVPEPGDAVFAAVNDQNDEFSLTAEAGTAEDAEGDLIPAVYLSFSEFEEMPDYVELYRADAEDEDCLWIATCVRPESAEVFGYCDRMVVPEMTYYYCAVAGWYGSKDEAPHIGKVTQVLSCTVELSRPVIEVQSSGAKGITVELPASGFLEKYGYAQAADSVGCAPGFQIYRSRSEDSGYKLIATVSGNEESYRDTTAVKGKLYFYKVCSYYSDKETGKTYTGEFSETRMCTVGSKGFPDAEALNLAAVRKSGSSAKINWNYVDGFAIDGLCYSVRKEGETTFGKTKYVECSKNATSCTIKDLKENCEYEILLLVRLKTPYSDGNDVFYYDSRWYAVRLDTY